MSNKLTKLSRWCRREAAWRDKAKDYKSFLSVKEFCEKYYCSKSSVYRKIQSRQIRAYRLKGKWFVKPYFEGYSEPIRRP